MPAKWRETTEELRNHYKDLKYVEQAFRTNEDVRYSRLVHSSF